MNQIGLWILSSFLELWPFLRVLNILGAMGTIAIGNMIGFSRRSRVKVATEQDEPTPGKRMLTESELEAEEELDAPEEIQDDTVAFIASSNAKAKEE